MILHRFIRCVLFQTNLEQSEQSLKFLSGHRFMLPFMNKCLFIFMNDTNLNIIFEIQNIKSERATYSIGQYFSFKEPFGDLSNVSCLC